MRFYLLAIIILRFSSIFLPLPVFAQSHSVERAEKYAGEYSVEPSDAKKTQDFLESLVDQLKMPGDPEYKIHYINHSEASAYIKDYKDIYITKGMLRFTKNIDQLAFVIAHEMAHADSRNSERDYVQIRAESMLEEMKVADKGGLERMSHAGYNTKEALLLMTSLLSLGSDDGRFLDFFLKSHPNSEVRITVIMAWMSARADTLKFHHPIKKPSFMSHVEGAPELNLGKKGIVSISEILKSIAEDSSFKEMERYRQIDFLSELAVNNSFRQSVVDYYVGGQTFSYGGWEDVVPDRGHGRLRQDAEQNERPVVKLAKNDQKGFDNIYQFMMKNYGGRLRQRVRMANWSSDWVSQLNFLKGRALKLADSINPVDIRINSFQEYQKYRTRLSADQKIRALESLVISSQPGDKVLAQIFNERIEIQQPKIVESDYDREDQRISLSKREEKIFLSRIVNIYRGAVNLKLRNILTGAAWAGEFSLSNKLFEKLINKKGVSIMNKTLLAMNYITQESRSYSERQGVEKGRGLTPLIDLYRAHNLNLKDLQTLGRRLAVLRNWKYYGGLVRGVLENSFVAYLRSRPDLIATRGRITFILTNEVFWSGAADSKLSDLFSEVNKVIGPENHFYINLKRESSYRPNPSYYYDLVHSERLQKLLYEKLRSLGEFRNSSSEYEWWKKFADKGATEFTDNWASNIFKKKNMSPKELKEVLSGRLIWDFSLRKKVFLKIYPYIKKASRGHKRKKMIEKIADFAELVFEEHSRERAEVLEFISDDLKTNMKEAKSLERRKNELGVGAQSGATRIVSSLYDELKRRGRAKKSYYQLVRFLVLGDKPPPELEKIIEGIGESRIHRLFQGLSPELRALTLNPAMSPPTDLLSSKYGGKILKIITDDVTGHQKTANLFLKGLLYSLDKVAPYEKTLAVSLMLGLKAGRAGAQNPGKSIRMFLEAYGHLGVSIGQKIYQRKLLPTEYLEELSSLQDRTRLPSRFEIFKMVSEALSLKKIDKVLEFKKVLGGASARIAIRIRYKTGEIKNIDVALKLLRDRYSSRVDLEIKKLDHLIDYVEEKGGPEFRRLRAVIGAVKRSLILQKDVRNEIKAYKTMKRIYEPMSTRKVQFVVMAPIESAGYSQIHSHEQLAEGRGYHQLSVNEKAEVKRAIFNAEKQLLLGSFGKYVYFEGDRHAGNWKFRWESGKLVIQIYDYLLVSRISVEQRDSLLKVVGYLSLRTENKSSWFMRIPIVSDYIRRYIGGRVSPKLIDNLMNLVENAGELDSGRVKSHLSKTIYSLSSKHDKVGALFELFGQIEILGGKIRPVVQDYLTALGHAEFYDPFSGGKDARSLQESIRAKVKREILEEQALGKTPAIEVKPVAKEFEQVGLNLCRRLFRN